MKYKANTTRKVRCKSGLFGERSRLQSRYSDYETFEAWTEIYDIHGRLGFSAPEDAWRANPIIESSTNPSDLRVVKI